MATVIEQVLKSLQNESLLYNTKLYTIKPLTLPTSMYKFIIENGRLEPYLAQKQFKVSIKLNKLKEHRSKKVKRFCATYLIKDFIDLEVIYVYHLDSTVSVHRRLIGLNCNLTV